jgi:16S rRNA (cytosine967-C5)-methyltransferase
MALATMRSDPRALAWEVLNGVEGGGFADALLARRLRTAPVATKDRRLATRLVYGTIAWQGLLDHVIGNLGRAPRKLDLEIRTLLRLALFQLVKLDRVPDFAAVDTAVDLAKEFRNGGAAGFVNALLRRFLRQGKELGIPTADPVEELSIRHSHPRWLVELWLRELGRSETEALLAANNHAAPTVLRVNTRRTERETVLESMRRDGISASPTDFAATGVAIELDREATQLGTYKRGLVSFQGEASQLATELLGPSPGPRILDACAAPGGKATQLAERIADGSFVVAIDRNAAGLTHLRRDATRLEVASRLGVLRADSAVPPITAGQRFDAVLLDAPCSGLGTLRQHPEIRWRRNRADLADLAQRQQILLDNLAAHLRPGGVLVYATCTMARPENQEVVASFLGAHPDFRVEDPRPFLPEPARIFVDADGFFVTAPHRQGLDGFFAARLKRVES